MSISRENIDQAIAERLASDPAFRAALLSDPHSALAALSGAQIPESVRVTVHEESPADIHLVIAASSTLSDTDLELVSGGYDWYPDNHSCAGIPQ
jgi:hypothetical protein